MVVLSNNIVKIIMSVRAKFPRISYKIKTPTRSTSPTIQTASSNQDSRSKSPLQAACLISNLRSCQVSPVSTQILLPHSASLSQRFTESTALKASTYSIIHRRTTPVPDPVAEMTVSELKAEIKESHKTISKLRAQNISLNSERDKLRKDYNTLTHKFEEAKESMRYLTCTLTDILTSIIKSSTKSSELMLNTKFNLIPRMQNAMLDHIHHISNTSGDEFKTEMKRISNWTTLVPTGNYGDFLGEYSNSRDDEVPIVSIKKGSLTERADRNSFSYEISNESLYDSFVLGIKDSFPKISVKNLPVPTDEVISLTNTKVNFNQPKQSRTSERKTRSAARESKYELKENISFHIEETPGVEKNAIEYRTFGDTLKRALLPSNYVRNR